MVREDPTAKVRLLRDTPAWFAEYDDLSRLLELWKQGPSNGMVREKVIHSLFRVGIVVDK
jgi:hypothetical protein